VYFLWSMVWHFKTCLWYVMITSGQLVCVYHFRYLSFPWIGNTRNPLYWPFWDNLSLLSITVTLLCYTTLGSFILPSYIQDPVTIPFSSTFLGSGSHYATLYFYEIAFLASHMWEHAVFDFLCLTYLTYCPPVSSMLPNDRISLIVLAEYIHTRFMHSSIGRSLCWLHVLAVVSNVSINMWVEMLFFGMLLSFPLDMYPVRVTESYGSSNFLYHPDRCSFPAKRPD
jgi:hypothetical protein